MVMACALTQEEGQIHRKIGWAKRTRISIEYPSSDLTPDKLTAILRQADFGDPYLYLELAEEIEEKDQHYLAVMNKRKGAVSGLEINVTAASSERKDVDIAHSVEDILLDESSEV